MPGQPPEFREALEEPPVEFRDGRRRVHSADVYVLFTSFEGTLAALRVASELARPLGSAVHLIDFHVVQVGAPVEAPTGRPRVEGDGFLNRLRAEGIDVKIDVYVCRDARRTILQVFKDRSLVLIGARHHWWPTRADRWRRMLEQRGHLVLFVGQDGQSSADGRHASQG
jgi:hypothetical protein